MVEESKKNEPVIHTDEDWKQRVKAEDAALDEKFREEAAQNSEAAPPDKAAHVEQGKESRHERQAGAKIEARQIPPASFPTLIGMFSTQAMVSLGLVPNPSTGKAEVQLELARHFIDVMGVLEEKTKGNLDEGEAKLLETTLYQLRMAFVERSNSPQTQADQSERTHDTGTSGTP